MISVPVLRIEIIEIFTMSILVIIFVSMILIFRAHLHIFLLITAIFSCIFTRGSNLYLLSLFEVEVYSNSQLHFS